MPTPTLILTKPLCRDGRTPLSRAAPWRIGVQWPDGRFVPLSHYHFARKRDGLPFLQRLRALGIDWSQPPEAWPEDQRVAAASITEETPGVQALQALAQRDPWQR